MLSVIIGTACLIWYIAVVIVCALGYFQLYRHYSKQPRPAVSESLSADQIPHVTIIRPVKGLEPELYQCLASTFQQSYPRDKLTVYFCVSSREDPSLSVLEQVLKDYRKFDAKILVENEDPALLAGEWLNFGPNPKIRNMSRAYREARGDIVWIIDCNVWVAKGVAGRMVDKLCGLRDGTKYKFVHQLPIVVDVTNQSVHSTLEDHGHEELQAASTSTSASDTMSTQQLGEHGMLSRASKLGGTRLEEMFLSSSHAKFYTAINTVLIAPCIVGKSNMFRRSHLDSLTANALDDRPSGIDYFSHNICEDHLIGDLLWKSPVPSEVSGREHFGKHALVFGDLAIQPMAGMSVAEYTARRVRWLRVRKFTVLLATLVEPGTESFLCSAYGAYAMTSLPWLRERLGVPPTWAACVATWAVSVTLWALVDWTLFRHLQSMASIEVNDHTPAFTTRRQRRGFFQWVAAWLGRETLALPIWILAVYGGVTVVWRGKRFRVSLDARVHAVDDIADRGSSIRSTGATSVSALRDSNGHIKSRNE